MTDRSLHVESTAHEDRALDAALPALADGRRRTLLSQLLAGRGRMSVSDLAERVAAAEAGVRRRDVDENRRRDVAVSLHHAHLPKLRDAGLIEVADGEAVATDRAERLDGVIAAVEGVASSDAALSALAGRRRRSALRHAASVDGSLPLSALAARVALDADDERDDVALDLHHRHLPKLDDAGLLEYDATERRIADAADLPLDGDLLVEALDRALGDSSAFTRADVRTSAPL